MDEYREEVRAILEESAEENYNYSLEAEAWDAALEKAEMEKYPEDELGEIKDQLIQQYKDAAEAYGMSYDVHHKPDEHGCGELRGAGGGGCQAVPQGEIHSPAIAEEENLTPADEEYEEHFQELAESYGLRMWSPEESRLRGGLKDMVLQEIVQEWLAKNCIQVVNE